MSTTLTNEGHQRSLKDFLTLYNTITEYCFNKCVSKFNERMASDTERVCVDTCSDNYVQYNQRFMFNFVDHQERRKRDIERVAAEMAAKEQEQQQQQMQQAAAALVAGQASADVAVGDAGTPTVVPPAAAPGDLPLKTCEAAQLLESLSGATITTTTGAPLDPAVVSKLGEGLSSLGSVTENSTNTPSPLMSHAEAQSNQSQEVR